MMSKNNVRKAIILGIGHAQVDAIRYLKLSGWFLIGCGYKKEGPGLALVDQFERVDIINSDAIEALAAIHSVRFVYSIGSDIAMPTVAKVSNHLGLPSFITIEQAELLQSKVSLRRLLNHNNISPVEFTAIKDLQEVSHWTAFPAMMKPVDSQGQRGVFLIESPDDLSEKFDQSIKFSKSKTVILEEYLAGPEISANVFVHNGKIVVNIISDRITVPGFPGGIPQSHHMPSNQCVGLKLEETNQLIRQCIDIIGIQNGPVYFQIKLTAKGPCIIEIAPRLDGCHLWRLIKLFCDVDLLDMTFSLLTDQELKKYEYNQKCETIQLAFSFAGPGERYQEDNDFQPDDMIYRERYYEEGDIVQPVNGFLEKTGFMILGDR